MSIVARVLARRGIARAVAEVHAGVAGPNAGEGGGQEHLRLGLGVVAVANGLRQVGDGAAEGLEREDVRDGVGALVCRTQDRIRQTRNPLGVRQHRPRLQRTAQRVEIALRVPGRGHGARVERVADAQRRAER